MTKVPLVALATLISVHLFATETPGKNDPGKSKKAKTDQSTKKQVASPAADDVYCSTRTEWYSNYFTTVTASCTKCTGTQAMAEIMAQNCAFQTARYNASQIGFVDAP